MEYFFDAIVDTLKTLPFLYLAYLAVEQFEHRSQKKLLLWLQKSQRAQTLVGALTGIIPGCGFALAATGLFTANIISFATLVAVYLVSCDEAYLYFLAAGKFSLLIMVLSIMFLIALFSGYLAGFLLKAEFPPATKLQNEHRDCDDNIFITALQRCLKIALLLLVTNTLFNLLLSSANLSLLGNSILNQRFLQPAFTALIALIPNCALSVLFANLYFHSLISFGSLISGLLASSGTSYILLFQSSLKFSLKIKIIAFILTVAILSGCLLSFFTFD